MKKRRGAGCLQIAAIAVFALLIGAFAASTLHRYAASDGSGSGGGAAGGAGEPDPALSPTEHRAERARIRVEVRNGSGTLGAAERTTAFLRERGFDVVDFGNSERFDHARTIVIDRSGNPAFAREVAAALQGVPIVSEPDSSLYLDVTVRIGADLSRLLDDGEAPQGRSWRGWLERIQWPWE